MISANTLNKEVMDKDAISRCMDSGSMIVNDVTIMMSVLERRSWTPRMDGIVSLIMRR